VTRGGTRIGDAIAFAAQTVFDDVEWSNKEENRPRERNGWPIATGNVRFRTLAIGLLLPAMK
jgi:hypothetical protein